MDAEADIDAPLQESKQGTVMIETVLCGLCYILQLGELYRLHYNSVSYWMPRRIMMHRYRGTNKELC